MLGEADGDELHDTRARTSRTLPYSISHQQVKDADTDATRQCGVLDMRMMSFGEAVVHWR